MKFFHKTTISLILILLTTVLAAEVPRTLSYQGLLANANGEIAPDGVYNLRFRIYSQPSGGNELWEEFIPAAVEEGIFSVILGKSNPLGIPFDKPLWLGIAVESGGELAPRTELTASAYSLYSSAIADSIVSGSNIADGQVVRNINGLSDAVNIIPGNNVTVTPSGNSLIIAAGDSIGGGGNSPWTVSGNDIFFLNGNVGIGTSNPSERLDVNGNLRLPATRANGTAGVIISDNERGIHFYGTNNIFAGKGSGNFTMLSPSSHNTALGYNTLQNLTTGAFNTAIGALAMQATTTGFQNSAVGFSALANNSTGRANTAFGANAMKMTTLGDYNTAVGDSSLSRNIGGGYNTAIGSKALVSNVSGGSNTALGSGADVAHGNLSHATAIGAGAIVDASYKMRLGNDQVTAVETAGTITAAAFVGDGSGLTNVPTSRWTTNQNDIYFNSGNVGIGTDTPGLFPGAHKYLTIMATQTYNSKVAALELQGANSNFGLPVARIDFSAVGSSRSITNAAQISAFNGSSTNNGQLAFYTHDGNTLNEALRLDQFGNATVRGEMTATTFNGELDAGSGTIAGWQLDILRGSSGQALTVHHQGSLLSPFLPVAEIKVTQDPAPGVDLFGVSATSVFGGDAQFIECHRGTDIEFRVDGDGEVYADGSFNGGGADFAEMMAVSEDINSVEAGDVMVIDPNSSRALQRSSSARSSLVAGIYSSKPGFVGSERDWDDNSTATEQALKISDLADRFNEIPMAVIGIVPCKVSAENGAIQPGDLLVTSSIPGHAMRDGDPKNGTILGKALGSLSSGTGVIKVLVTLQ